MIMQPSDGSAVEIFTCYKAKNEGLINGFGSRLVRHNARRKRLPSVSDSCAVPENLCMQVYQAVPSLIINQSSSALLLGLSYGPVCCQSTPQLPEFSKARP